MTTPIHFIANIIAAGYCFALALLSIYKNPNAKLNRLFAAYNLCNGIWNCGDTVAYFFPHTQWSFPWRITGIAGCFFIPFIVSFTIEVSGYAKRAIGKIIVRSFYGLGFIFAVLHQTPWLHTTVVPGLHTGINYLDVGGKYYPAFQIYLLSGMIIMIISLICAVRTAKGQNQKQIAYILGAFAFGLGAVAAYALSDLFNTDLGWLYYPLQTLVGLTFGYAIFKHDLVAINVSLRRVALFIGIYFVLILLFTPVLLVVYHHVSDIGYLGFVAVFLVGSLTLSSGSFLYAHTVYRSALFQDTEALQLTHEFKSPLAAIQSAQEILDRELAQPTPDPVKVQDYMSMIQRNTQRLEKFVMDILNVGKAGETSRAIQRDKINLIALLRSVIAHFPKAAAEIKVTENPAVVEGNVFGDEESLQQVFTNLIANALASGANEPIEISIQQSEKEICIIVRDTGKGILKEDLERIFQPFAQSKNNAQAKSTGLGLAIAERWVRAHNGRIWAESEGVGKGAAFFVVLPSL